MPRNEPTLTDEVTAEKATIFRLGAFGYRKTEVRKLRTGRAAAWAQYRNVPYASYIVKRKRKRECFYEGYKPTTVILPGWGLDLTPASPLVPTAGGAVTRWTSYDPRYAWEFSAKLDAWLKANKVTPLVDYRADPEDTTCRNCEAKPGVQCSAPNGALLPTPHAARCVKGKASA